MAELGRQTINNIEILEVDADPSVFPGCPAPIGSQALFDDQVNQLYGSWQKIGPNDTDWAKLNPDRKSGTVFWNLFSGTPLVFDVVFALPFPIGSDYVVHINGSADRRLWSYENVSNTGFRINSNSRTLLTGKVSWTASISEETS